MDQTHHRILEFHAQFLQLFDKPFQFFNILFQIQRMFDFFAVGVVLLRLVFELCRKAFSRCSRSLTSAVQVDDILHDRPDQRRPLCWRMPAKKNAKGDPPWHS